MPIRVVLVSNLMQMKEFKTLVILVHRHMYPLKEFCLQTIQQSVSKFKKSILFIKMTHFIQFHHTKKTKLRISVVFQANMAQVLLILINFQAMEFTIYILRQTKMSVRFLRIYHTLMRKADIQAFRTSQKNDLFSDKFVGTLLLGQSNDFIKT